MSAIATLAEGGTVLDLGDEKSSSVQVSGKRLAIDDFIGKEQGLYSAVEQHTKPIREFLTAN